MFRIAVNNEIELDAQVPAVHMPKLSAGAPVRISRDDAPDLIGRVRLVAPEIDRATQLGRVRISVANNPSLRIGTFARASIDAKRSCGVSIPKTAIDHLTIQVVKGNTIETRRCASRTDVRAAQRKSWKVSRSAKSSSPTPALRCMTATGSKPCSPMNSIARGYADGS